MSPLLRGRAEHRVQVSVILPDFTTIHTHESKCIYTFDILPLHNNFAV